MANLEAQLTQLKHEKDQLARRNIQLEEAALKSNHEQMNNIQCMKFDGFLYVSHNASPPHLCPLVKTVPFVQNVMCKELKADILSASQCNQTLVARSRSSCVCSQSSSYKFIRHWPCFMGQWYYLALLCQEKHIAMLCTTVHGTRCEDKSTLFCRWTQRRRPWRQVCPAIYKRAHICKVWTWRIWITRTTAGSTRWAHSLASWLVSYNDKQKSPAAYK